MNVELYTVLFLLKSIVISKGKIIHLFYSVRVAFSVTIISFFLVLF